MSNGDFAYLDADERDAITDAYFDAGFSYTPAERSELLSNVNRQWVLQNLPKANIGAKVACPDAEVWVVCGDGGFQMTMPEIATMVQEGLDVNVAIINNGYLGMVRQWQEFFYERRYAATPLIGPDFAKLAQAFGISGVAVSKRADVAGAVEAARRSGRAALIDFQVEQEDSVYPMVPAGAALHDMIRRPSPIVETAGDD